MRFSVTQIGTIAQEGDAFLVEPGAETKESYFIVELGAGEIPVICSAFVKNHWYTNKVGNVLIKYEMNIFVVGIPHEGNIYDEDFHIWVSGPYHGDQHLEDNRAVMEEFAEATRGMKFTEIHEVDHIMEVVVINDIKFELVLP